jgi:hypothetical protein
MSGSPILSRCSSARSAATGAPMSGRCLNRRAWARMPRASAKESPPVREKQAPTLERGCRINSGVALWGAKRSVCRIDELSYPHYASRDAHCAAVGAFLERQRPGGKTAQLLKMYRECVIDAIGSQLRNSSGEVNPSAATEVAFQACRTEEQAIFAHASAGGVAPAQANQAITEYKLGLKQQVRKLFASPEKYAPRPQPATRQTTPAPAEVAPPRPGCSGNYRRYDGAWIYTNCN